MLHHQASLIGEKRRDPALFGHTPLACRLPPPPQPCSEILALRGEHENIRVPVAAHMSWPNTGPGN
ncbi:MAG: hypothetical protein DMG38_23170 [Acidobacteria bacterium]|nr:MAG: hypothetical protein DMG38_23170 [Acidobacteriota bacterium]